MTAIRVYLEIGETSAFAVALDWPGWCRRARTSDLALEALDRYRPRYAAMVTESIARGPLEVIATVPGNRTTDFGAPSAIGEWDASPMTSADRARYVERLRDCWDYFDLVVLDASSPLTKGPRGGGRDRDAMVDHVREAERAYGAKIGVRVAPRTPWGQQRSAIEAGLVHDGPATPWPRRYAIRRMAWHVSDHAWEMQDRRP